VSTTTETGASRGDGADPPGADAAATEPRSWLRHDFWPLYRRGMLITLRQPSRLIPPLFIPIFFLVVNVAALQEIIALPAFPTDDYVAFFVPVPILMAVASIGNAAGFIVVEDIESGYFDKLLLAPIGRMSILLTRLAVDGTRAALQTLLVLGVAVLYGGRIASGWAGVPLIVALGFLFGLAYAGIGLTVALRTGNAEATQSSFILFFPLVFLAPTFVPMEVLAPWLQTAASWNPITYVIEGIRVLTVEGFVLREVAGALTAIGAIGALTLSGAFLALRARVNA
jgi:ABC-2 type transport system permease protein